MRLLEFDGRARDFVIIGFVAFLLIVFTFGLAFPWATTMLLRWKTNHTLVNGRRLKFKGTGSGLFGKWIVWWLLSIITFGLFGIIVWARYQKWIVENTAIEDDKEEYLDDDRFEDDILDDHIV